MYTNNLDYKEIQSLLSENEILRAENKMLRHLAFEDGLTAIPNRRAFDRKLVEEFARCDRTQGSVVLLLIDIDHFKRYNDEYGHQAGDILLRKLAFFWSQTPVRLPDMLARYGGEEFAIVLPDSSVEGAQRIAKEVQIVAREQGVTVSIGIAELYPCPSSRPEDLIAAADSALYSAKQQGRDRVVIAQ